MPNRSISFGGAVYALDVRPDRLDLRDRPYLPPTISLPTVHPEPSVLAQYFPDYVAQKLVLNQGRSSACTGFGLAAVINYLLWLRAVNANNMASFRPVSPHMLYDMARFYDEWPGQSYEGSSCRGAMKGWHKHGVCHTTLWRRSIYPPAGSGAKKPPKHAPYRPNGSWAQDASGRPVGVYYRVDRKSVTDLQAAIKDVGAVYVSGIIHEGWKLAKAVAPTAFNHENIPRITYKAKAKSAGGHAFALVGYNEDGFIVQNSWGEGWGLNGFAVLHYDDWADNGVDAWVCALGVPQTRRNIAASATGQQASVSRRANSASLLMGDVAVKAKPTNPLAQPWSTELAYLHSVVAGNDGVVERCRPDIATPADMVNSVMVDPVLHWLKDAGSTSKRIMIFAHGGLNSEAEAIQRARVLGPYFQENGIYPTFYIWKTGIGETLKEELSDRLTPQQMEAVATGGFADARDALIEVAAHGPLRWAWRQMKENAELATKKDHAIDLMVEALKTLRAAHPDLEVHLVGHSAGSFVHGHLLDAAKAASLNMDSLTLYAPACPLDFALTHIAAAVNETRLAANRLWLHILSDKNERDDHVVSDLIYGKSLLYLVDRGFEEERKTPLAGLERTIDGKLTKPSDDLWAEQFWPDVLRWRDWVSRLSKQSDGQPACEILTNPTVSTGNKSIAAAHGSFDNDCDVVTRTINRLLGQKPNAKLKVRVEDLDF
jgi:Papain family cysteine protease